MSTESKWHAESIGLCVNCKATHLTHSATWSYTTNCIMNACKAKKNNAVVAKVNHQTWAEMFIKACTARQGIDPFQKYQMTTNHSHVARNKFSESNKGFEKMVNWMDERYVIHSCSYFLKVALEVLLTSIMQVHMKVNKQVNLGLTNTLFVFKDLFLNLAQVKLKAVACWFLVTFWCNFFSSKMHRTLLHKDLKSNVVFTWHNKNTFVSRNQWITNNRDLNIDKLAVRLSGCTCWSVSSKPDIYLLASKGFRRQYFQTVCSLHTTITG